jgi:hypothetical protein
VAAPARAPTPPPTTAPIPAPRPPPAIAPITAPVPAPTRPPPNARSAGLYGSARAVVANINPAPIRQPIVASLLICPTPNLQREQTTMVCSSGLVRWAGRTKPVMILRRSGRAKLRKDATRDCRCVCAQAPARRVARDRDCRALALIPAPCMGAGEGTTRLLSNVSNVETRSVPTVPIIMTAATAISVPSKPYLIPVTPSLSE